LIGLAGAAVVGAAVGFAGAAVVAAAVGFAGAWVGAGVASGCGVHPVNTTIATNTITRKDMVTLFIFVCLLLFFFRLSAIKRDVPSSSKDVTLAYIFEQCCELEDPER